MSIQPVSAPYNDRQVLITPDSSAFIDDHGPFYSVEELNNSTGLIRFIHLKAAQLIRVNEYLQADFSEINKQILAVGIQVVLALLVSVTVLAFFADSILGIGFLGATMLFNCYCSRKALEDPPLSSIHARADYAGRMGICSVGYPCCFGACAYAFQLRVRNQALEMEKRDLEGSISEHLTRLRALLGNNDVRWVQETRNSIQFV